MNPSNFCPPSNPELMMSNPEPSNPGTTFAASPAVPPSARRIAIWLVLLAAGGTFALTMGVRQTMGLFLSSLNTSTALGIGSISLAFAFGQLWWGLTQPFAGAVADRIGTGRVIFLGGQFECAGSAGRRGFRYQSAQCAASHQPGNCYAQLSLSGRRFSGVRFSRGVPGDPPSRRRSGLRPAA
jgi:hypothetical protein